MALPSLEDDSEGIQKTCDIFDCGPEGWDHQTAPAAVGERVSFSLPSAG